MTNARTLFADLADDDLLIELRRSVATERAAAAHLIELLAEDVTLTSLRLIGPHLTSANSGELLAAARHKSKRDVERLVAAVAPKADVPASVRKLPVRAGIRQCGPVGDATPTAARASTAAVGAPRARPLPAIECTEDAAECSEPRTQSTTPESVRPTVKIDALQRQMPAAMALPPARPAVVAPLAPERYKIQFTASRELLDKLRRAQDLLRHTIPDGDVAAVFDRALTLLVEELERRKLAAAARPRPPQSLTSESRYIPAAVKRLVWARDGAQCTFIGNQGRCAARGFLEFHHLVPFAAGGETSAGNISLRCRAHNQFEAQKIFGPLFARDARVPYDMESARSGPS